jgi:ubiquinone/menaquinone biosynthesis C-methylase UbiE
MQMDETKWAALDRTFADLLETLASREDPEERLTLAYTAGLHRAWRPVLRVLPIYPAWRVLDVGTGFGILPLEIAAHIPVTVHGLDLVPAFIAGARQAHKSLEAREHFHPGSRVAFDVGDALALPYEPESFEVGIVRELLQFVEDPLAVLRELHRVIVPDGYACVSDMDDQLYLTWPPASEAFQRLHQAIAAVQVQRGGDRHVGRKLTTFLTHSGFRVDNVLVLPEAMHHVVEPTESERRLVLDQFAGARQRVLDAGLLSAADYDRDLAAVATEPRREEFRMNARIVALARRLPS